MALRVRCGECKEYAFSNYEIQLQLEAEMCK